MNDLDPEFTREILRKVRQLEIRSNRLVSEIFAGSYHSAFRGQGIDFEEVREYQPGDEVRSIDWNVTAKTGLPFVKLYREERELTIMLAVDISKSSAYGSAILSKREKFAELAALLAFSACRNGDKVGLLLFTDQTELYLPPTKGQKHVLRILREILFRPALGSGTKLSEGVRMINQVTRKKVVVFLLSDFIFSALSDAEKDSAKKTLLQELAYTRIKHDLICGKIIDPKEHNLPDVGLVKLEDPETGQSCIIDTGDDQIRQEYKKSFEQMDQKLTKEFKKHGIDQFHLSTEEDCSEELLKFFKVREKRRH